MWAKVTFLNSHRLTSNVTDVSQQGTPNSMVSYTLSNYPAETPLIVLTGLKAKRYGEDECCSQDRVTVTVTTIPPYCASSAVAGLPEASSAAPTSAAAGGQTSVAPTSAAAGESSMPASSTLAGETTAAPVSQATGKQMWSLALYAMVRDL